MQLEQLGDFNNVLKCYDDFISLLARNPEELYENINGENPIKKDYLLLTKCVINSMALSISQSHARIDIEDENVYIEKLKGIECVDKIVEKYKISYKEAARQIRNCFCHGGYSLELDETKLKHIPETNSLLSHGNPLSLFISNVRELPEEKKDIIMIESKITLEELFEIEQAFAELTHQQSALMGNYITVDSNYENATFKEKQHRAVHPHDYSYIDKKVEIRRTKIIESKDEGGLSVEQASKILSKIHKQDSAEIQALLNKRKFENINLDYSDLSKHDKEFIKAYISYIGISNWDESAYYRQKINENIFQSTTEDHIEGDLLFPFFIYSAIDRNMLDQDDQQMYDENMKVFSLAGPFLYANLLLGKAYYSMVYAREINEKESIYFYKNIDNLPQPDIDKDSKSFIDMDYSRMQTKKENELKTKKRQTRSYIGHEKINGKGGKGRKGYIENLKIKIGELEQRKKGLDEDTEAFKSIENELKQLKSELEENQNEVENKENELNQINEELKKLQEDYANLPDSIKEPYVDSSNYFKHIRDSIAHGFYKIDYNKALRSGNMEDIEFELYDYTNYYIKRDDLKQTLPSFKLTITAKEFITIIESLQKSINEQVQPSCDQRLTHIESSREIENRLQKGDFEFEAKDYSKALKKSKKYEQELYGDEGIKMVLLERR